MTSIFGATLVATAHLLVAIDPIGTTAMFMLVKPPTTRTVHIGIAATATILASSILGAIAILGPTVLFNMQIGMDNLRIGGGLLLLIVAWRIGRRQIQTQSTKVQAFVILTYLLAGPGCMTTTLLAVGRADVVGTRMPVLAGVVGVEVLAFATLVGAPYVLSISGSGWMVYGSRFATILLVALGLQALASGLLAA